MLNKDIINVKNILKIVISVLVIVSMIKSCANAWTYTDWVDYLGQLRVRDDVSSTWKTKINKFFQYESDFASKINGYTNFYFDMSKGDTTVYATNNTLNITRVNTNPNYAPIEFSNVSWVRCWRDSSGIHTSNNYLTSLDSYPALVEVSESIEAQFTNNMWFQNKYDLGFTFEPVGVTEVNYNGYQGLNAKKVNSNLITLGTLTNPSEKYKYYRFKLLDSGGNLVGWLNYNTDNDYYSGNNIDAFLSPLTIYVQRRLIYLQQIYTLVIYAADEPFNNDDTNVDDSEVLTYIFLPQNAVITGDTIINPGSGDSYTIQDSTNDIINNLYNENSGDNPGIVQKIYEDLFAINSGEMEQKISNLYDSLELPSGEKEMAMAGLDVINNEPRRF